MTSPNIQLSSYITAEKDALSMQMKSKEVIEDITTGNDQGEFKQDELIPTLVPVDMSTMEVTPSGNSGLGNSVA